MSEADTPQNADVEAAALRLEAEALKHQSLTDRRVIEKLRCIADSPIAAENAQQLHQRYQQAIERRGQILETLLQDAEERCGQLQEQNLRLHKTLKHLRYKLKCAHYELKKALGVKASTGEKEAEQTDEAHNAQKRPATKTNGPRKRAAPKGHRGRTRPIPQRIDFTEEIPPPERCECGCSQIEALDAFDSRYIEDIPPVSRIVTERKYQRGRCSGCGKELRHPQARQGPAVVIGPDLAVHLTLMNQMGTTLRKLERVQHPGAGDRTLRLRCAGPRQSSGANAQRQL